MLAALLLLLAPAGEITTGMWTAIRPIYDKTLQHPFLKGLADGTLPRSRFQFYLVQDALYLRTFARALSVLASKAPREEWAITLNTHAIDSLKVERQLHKSLLGSFGVAKSRIAAARMAPTNYAYTNHLLAAVERGSFAEGLAALLPCYWIYLEVGRELKKKGSSKPEYQQWIDQYAGEDYGNAVSEVLAMMNAQAGAMNRAGHERLTELFTLSARYEYLFWDMAWREEKWAP